MQLKDSVVVVTGGARGIGKAIAAAFGDKGAKLALLDLNQLDLDTTHAEFTARGVETRTYAVNVAKEDQVGSAFDQILADFGRIDVVVNNAGIIKDGLLIKVKDGAVVGRMKLDQWQAVIDVNLTGAFLCGREAAERMIKAGRGGLIINISSISGGMPASRSVRVKPGAIDAARMPKRASSFAQTTAIAVTPALVAE